MNITGESSVLKAINSLGGVYMLGRYVPIWLVVITEPAFAFTFEMLVGSPYSFKQACKKYDIKKTDHNTFEKSIITNTVVIMVPIMSFIAAFLYYPYYMGFNIFTLLANFLKLVCFNFPFAYFSQHFFIQPMIRKVFKLLFKRK